MIPIFKVGDVLEPEAFGGAALIELVGQRFLVTARHVVDEYLKSRVHTVGASGYVVITRDFFCAQHWRSLESIRLWRMRIVQKGS